MGWRSGTRDLEKTYPGSLIRIQEGVQKALDAGPWIRNTL
jgi:hypothetical protein